MTKYPKTVWVGFDGELFPWNVWKSKPAKMPLGVTGKRYHLHPGNEVKKVRGELAKAQIVKDLNYLYECPSPMGTALVAKRFGVGFKNCRFV